MRINVHAGHNPEGKIACGARGILDESRENRIVKNKVTSCCVQQGMKSLTAPLMMVLVRVTCLEGLWQNVTHEM